jgi:aminomethyltransferase
LTQLKRTPLYDCHSRLGAKFTEFGGWDMPVQYAGLVQEHHGVRNSVGLFDVSHMGEITVKGPKALEFLQHVTTNDVSKLVNGKAQYSLLLNEEGGVVDDIIIYKFADADYFICVNAGNTEKDFSWLVKHNAQGAELKNVSANYAQIALQGPKARAVLANLLNAKVAEVSIEKFPAFTFQSYLLPNIASAPVDVIVAATGYTGEDGFELFIAPEFAPALWEKLLACGAEFGIQACGLGARDTLRLEVCYPLHGHEISDDINPLTAGLSWVIKPDKGDFIGRTALLKAKEYGLKSKLVGLEVVDPGIVRADAKLFNSDGEEVGFVTSGTKPPTVNRSVCLGFVPVELSAPESKLFAEVRGKKLLVKVVKTPFYKRTQ